MDVAEAFIDLDLFCIWVLFDEVAGKHEHNLLLAKAFEF
jgi:hypothetical protein